MKRKNNLESIKCAIEIDTTEAMSNLKTLRQEVKNVSKEIRFNINKLEMKRKDILVIKMNCIIKAEQLEQIKKKIEKQIHRKVLVINQTMDINCVITKK